MSKYGPQRLTIVIFKSAGDIPAYLRYPSGNYLPDTLNNLRANAVPVGPGDYILDARRQDQQTGSDNFRGEGYLINRIDGSDVYLSSSPTTKVLGQSKVMTASGTGVQLNAIQNWAALPGALVVFHTFIGD
jgi:hypothetical protein